MKFDPAKHRRRSIRLKHYDYSQSGAYFVTICAQNRACLFGAVIDGEMQLNDAGRMVEHWWLELHHKFPSVETDQFVIMPNHFHGIVVNSVGADLRVGPVGRDPDDVDRRTDRTGTHAGAPLPTIVQWFKTMTTNEYIRGIKQSAWTPFRGRLWQRNYYEHIIHNEQSLDRIRQYILDNPARWEFDRENPAAKTLDAEEPWRG